MARHPVPRLLRAIAWALIRGDDAPFILAELDDAAEREWERGLPRGTVSMRYLRNVAGSAFSLWRSRLSRSGSWASWLDVKLGLRMLTRHPGLTLAAGFALAVGIPVGLAPGHGARVFETPPPYDDPGRLQIVKNMDRARGGWTRTTAADYVRWSESASSFDDLAAVTGSLFNLVLDDGQALPVQGARVTASAFDILRVPPLLGRTLVPEDEVPGAPAVVVLGYAAWQARFGGDPEAVGRTIRIGADQRTVVGVMPEGFFFPIREGLWIPLSIDPTSAGLDARDYRVFGRLEDDVSTESAQAEFDAIGQRVARDFPESHAQVYPIVLPYTPGLYGIRGSLKDEGLFYIAQVLAVLILVVACANVGMLVFTRTTARSRELAVRTALGASRTRIVSQLFVESLVLALGAAGLGLLVADRVLGSSFAWLDGLVPVWFDFGVTPRTVAWALSLAALSAVVMGVLPAFRVTGKRVHRNIQKADLAPSGVRFGGIPSVLIIADVALAVATVTLAVGLHDRTDQVEEPYAAEQFLSATFQIPEDIEHGNDPQVAAAFRARLRETQSELVRRIRLESDVSAAAMASLLPGMDHGDRNLEIEGENYSDGERHRAAPVQIGAGFFEAFDRTIHEGRGFTSTDYRDGSNAVIVNTGFSEKLLGGRSPVGRRFRYLVQGEAEPGPWFEIVGMVGSLGMGRAANAGVYHPLEPGGVNPVMLVARIGNDPESFSPRFRAVAATLDPGAIVTETQRLDQVFSFNRFVLTWVAWGARIMIGILFALSVSGIYALMSFTVTARTKEIGIRTALGSKRIGLAATLARRAVVQLAIGVLIGGTISLALLWRIESDGLLSYEAPMLGAFLTSLALTLLIGIVSCTAPTLRALRIKPTEAFRSGG